MKLTKRAADAESPQAVFEGGGFEYRVLKTYQNDDSKDFARWFLATKSPYTYGSLELGDGYVRDVVLHAELTQVDGREPTEEELGEVFQLRMKLMNKVDPMTALGF